MSLKDSNVLTSQSPVQIDNYVSCTIVDAAYLPQALVLADSYLENNPKSRFFIVTIGFLPSDLILDPRIAFIAADELGIPEKIFQNMQIYYDIVEFATSLKPWLLLKLLDLGFAVVFYLDPDMMCFASLNQVYRLTKKNKVVLTPHRINLSSEKFPDAQEKSLLQYGVFNLGFIGCSKSSVDILEWWKKRLVYFSGRARFKHEFTDQKWINLLPICTGVVILRNYGFNVASFNLNERNLKFSNGSLSVNNDSLVLMHFTQTFSHIQNLEIRESELTNSNLLNPKMSSGEIYRLLLKQYFGRVLKFKNILKEVQYPVYKNQYKSVIFREMVKRKIIDNEIRKPSRLKFFTVLGQLSRLLVHFERSFFVQYGIYGLYKDLCRLAKRKEPTEVVRD